ncbi:MAG: hypothetical protein HYZ27_06925 [Deltaproteobacteria bacterium]|nr:hypothetical protein [Deltaproteobacteria bacterium]
MALLARLIPDAATTWADPQGVATVDEVRIRLAFGVWWWLAVCCAAALRSLVWGSVRLTSRQYLIVSRSWRWRWMALCGWTLAIAVPILSVGLMRRFGLVVPGIPWIAVVAVALAVAGEVSQAPQLWLDRQRGQIVWRGPGPAGGWVERTWPAATLSGDIPASLQGQLLEHLGNRQSAAWWLHAVRKKAAKSQRSRPSAATDSPAPNGDRAGPPPGKGDGPS